MKKRTTILCGECLNISRSSGSQKEGIHKATVLNICSMDLWESLRNFQGICQVKTIFIIILKRYLPIHYINICIAMVGKTAVALVWIKVVIPDCTNSHCICRCHIRAIKIKITIKQSKFHLRMSLWSNNFIKSWSLGTHIFNIPCDEIGRTHTILLCLLKKYDGLQEEHLRACLICELLLFSKNTIFT